MQMHVNERRFLRLPEVIEQVGLGRTSIYCRVRTGTFPKPYRLGDGARAVAWLASDIDDWIQHQIARGADQ